MLFKEELPVFTSMVVISQIDRHLLRGLLSKVEGQYGLVMSKDSTISLRGKSRP